MKRKEQQDIAFLSENGEQIGRNPTQMDVADLGYLGHKKKNPMRLIRDFCIECSGGNQSEARKCTAYSCQLWPYRMGKNPFRKVSDKQREAFKP